jgi:hypothetical protein
MRAMTTNRSIDVYPAIFCSLNERLRDSAKLFFSRPAATDKGRGSSQ